MADLSAPRLPEPAVHMKPTKYRIYPRNWQTARCKYLHYYREARNHRTIENLSCETYKRYPYFLDPVTLPEDCSSDLRKIGSLIEDTLYHIPNLHVYIKECEIQGPEGSSSIMLQLLDKLRPSVELGMPRISSVFHGASRSKRSSDDLVQPKSLTVADVLPKTRPMMLAAKIDNTEYGHEQVVIRVPGSKAKDLAGEWVPIRDTLIQIASIYEERLKKLALKLTGKSAATAYEADCAIDNEVERRIAEDLLARTHPIDDRFWLLPYGFVVEVFKQAMNVLTAGSNGGYGFFLLEYLAPAPTSLRLVDRPSWFNSSNSKPKTLRDVTAVASYSKTTFAFTTPSLVHRWLDALTPECLELVKRVGVQFETDVCLKYLEHFLGFVYDRSTSYMYSALIDKRLEELFKILDQGCRDPTLIFRFPNKGRMGFSDEHGKCHSTLCKWAAKAVGTFAAQYPKVKVVLEGHTYNNGTTQLTDDTLTMLRGIFNAPSKYTWVELGVRQQEDLSASLPTCHRTDKGHNP